MRFSKRATFDAGENRITEALKESPPRFDLTASNPTTANLPYDARLLDELRNPSALKYSPASFGIESARDAVARSYASLGHTVDRKNVCLTASTSEAYAHLFKLLADPADEILVPEPGYPLFTFLAALEGVRVRPYPIAYDGHWHINIGEVSRRISSATRAIVVVSPNNPTGSYLKKHELDALTQFDIPIISDEVFARYSLSDDPSRVTSVASEREGLLFSLGGLSKQCALPQIKVGWIVAAGNAARTEEAMRRLELIADTFLSVATPQQVALPQLLEHGDSIARAISERTVRNLSALRARTHSGDPWSLLHVEGGWYATIQIPNTQSEEEWILSLLRKGVLVHPGHFFDFPREAFLTLSLLTPPEEFDAGCTIVFDTIRTSLRNS